MRLGWFSQEGARKLLLWVKGVSFPGELRIQGAPAPGGAGGRSSGLALVFGEADADGDTGAPAQTAVVSGG